MRKLLGIKKILKYLAIGVLLVAGVGIGTVLFMKMKPDITNIADQVYETVQMKNPPILSRGSASEVKNKTLIDILTSKVTFMETKINETKESVRTKFIDIEGKLKSLENLRDRMKDFELTIENLD